MAESLRLQTCKVESRFVSLTNGFCIMNAFRKPFWADGTDRLKQGEANDATERRSKGSLNG